MNRLEIVFHPVYEFATQRSLKFPVSKYKFLRKKLEADGLFDLRSTYRPEGISIEEASRAHEKQYLERVFSLNLSKKERKIIGLEPIEFFANRALYSSAGTLLAARLAIKKGAAINMAGGSHHASYFHGAGYCIFNDVAITLNILLSEDVISSALVIDLDVHQGDGTAQIFREDDRVFTASIHCKDNYPLEKSISDLDIGLNRGADDRAYFHALGKLLEMIENKRFDLIIYNAGVDIHHDDKLGLLSVSSMGIRIREKIVIDFARRKNIPLAVVLGGGYNTDTKHLAVLHSYVFSALLDF